MARTIWKDWLDAPHGELELYEGCYHLDAEGFDYKDKVTVTVEHGEGIVKRLEDFLGRLTTLYEETKDSPYADKTQIELTKALIDDIQTVLEVQEKEDS